MYSLSKSLLFLLFCIPLVGVQALFWQQIPALDPSTNSTVLAWVATVSVLASMGMFLLLWRFVTQTQDRRWARIEDRQMIIIRALAKHPDVDLDLDDVVQELSPVASTEQKGLRTALQRILARPPKT